jgi:excisionase family DNA binding protein
MNKPLRVPEVSARLDVPAATVRRWLRDGLLKGQKLGPRVWRVDESELERFQKSQAGAKS